MLEKEIIVLKIGGAELDNPDFLAGFAVAVKEMTKRARPLIVHGGGKDIARVQEKLGLEPRFLEGLRITDEESLEVAEMVLSGLVNKRLVARLVSVGLPAMGLSGVDLGMVRVEKMLHPKGDLGWVGKIVEVRTFGLRSLMEIGAVPVISPISLGMDGHTYNVNADHAAQAFAVALPAESLVFVSNVPGVVIDGQLIPRLTLKEAEKFIEEGKIYGGMVPKVRSALEAVSGGVRKVRITDLEGLRRRGGGTTVVP